MIEIPLPDTIKIGGYDYTIVSSNELNKELNATARYADSNDCLRRIRLSTDTSEQQTSNDFIHECLHQADSVYNSHKLDETAVTQITNGLHQVFEQLGIRFVVKDS